AAHDEPHPVAEWGIRWLMRHAPPPAQPVLCHGDFRTGNYLADEHGFTALLDWDFAGWSDPDEDIAWFCLGYWRFGAYAREAGGLVPRAAFHRAYEAASGRAIDPGRVRYWEVIAALARHRPRAARPLPARRRALAAIAAQRPPSGGMRARDSQAHRADGRGGV